MAMLTNTCTLCKLVLPATAEYFYRSKKFDKCNGGLVYCCKKCDNKKRKAYNEKHKKKVAANKKQYYELNKDKIRSRMLLKHYGIDSEEYDNLLCLQDGICAICKQPETRKLRGKIPPLSVDHNHNTGKVRGLLCNTCNRAIGLLHDDSKLLKAAATKYVDVN